jgi:hypothetical protein
VWEWVFSQVPSRYLGGKSCCGRDWFAEAWAQIALDTRLGYATDTLRIRYEYATSTGSTTPNGSSINERLVPVTKTCLEDISLADL